MTYDRRGPQFFINADGSAVCAHRDLSVCPKCAEHPAIVEVVGAHFYVADPIQRAELIAELAAV